MCVCMYVCLCVCMCLYMNVCVRAPPTHLFLNDNLNLSYHSTITAGC